MRDRQTETDGDRPSIEAALEDSLSLLNSGPVPGMGGHDRGRAGGALLQPAIMILSSSGRELWATGDMTACRAYLQHTAPRAGDPSANAMSVDEWNGGLMISSNAGGTRRLVHIDGETLAAVMRELIPGITLPRSEFRLLVQILCGMTLKDAAGADRVSYETKRSQFKSLAARTHAKSQSDLIRRVLSAIAAHAFAIMTGAQPPANGSPDATAAFLERHYGGLVRFCQVTMGSGQVLRVAEAGPAEGRPLVWVHSQTLPPPGQFAGGWMERHGLRLIMPLRPGFLDGAAASGTIRDHLERSASDLGEVIALFAGGRAPVVANSTGAACAVELARSRPERIERLTFVAVAYVGGYESAVVRRFVAGVTRLATGSRTVLDRVLSRYLARMGTRAGLRQMILSAYGRSPRDMEIFDALLESENGHAWMWETYRLSRDSVARDIETSAVDVWKAAPEIILPVRFIHGRQDPINPVAKARRVAGRFPNTTFLEIAEEGQSLFLNRMEEVSTTWAA